MKKTLYLVLILIIIGLSYLKWQGSQQVSETAASPSPSTTPIMPVSGGLMLDSEYFTLEYPAVATLSPISESPDSTSWTVRYMGEAQVKSGRTQTELFDGYAVTVTVFPSVVGDDPRGTQAQSDREGTISGCGESSVTTIRDTEIAGKKTQTFAGGCIGEANHFYFMDDEILYRIVTMAVGTPEDVFTYQQTVDKMLTSLKLH